MLLSSSTTPTKVPDTRDALPNIPQGNPTLWTLDIAKLLPKAYKALSNRRLDSGCCAGGVAPDRQNCNQPCCIKPPVAADNNCDGKVILVTIPASHKKLITVGKEMVVKHGEKSEPTEKNVEMVIIIDHHHLQHPFHKQLLVNASSSFHF